MSRPSKTYSASMSDELPISSRKRPFEEQDHAIERDEAAPSNAEAGPSVSPRPSKIKRKKSKANKSGPSPGIVYVSRLPPGMTPQKVKHLMERWGEVGRIYAQKKEPTVGNKRPKHEKANYSEAWVEFLDKKMAKTVAEMLNAQVIGGKKGDRWRDDIWTMKYLSGFKWEMLGEQVAYERQAHTARLRQALSQSKTEQAEYLRNVELARVLDKRRAKKAETSGGQAGEAAAQGDVADKDTLVKAKRNYKQRGLVSQAGEKRQVSGGGGGGGSGAGAMDDVLNSLF